MSAEVSVHQVMFSFLVTWLVRRRLRCLITWRVRPSLVMWPSHSHMPPRFRSHGSWQFVEPITHFRHKWYVWHTLGQGIYYLSLFSPLYLILWKHFLVVKGVSQQLQEHYYQSGVLSWRGNKVRCWKREQIQGGVIKSWHNFWLVFKPYLTFFTV